LRARALALGIMQEEGCPLPVSVVVGGCWQAGVTLPDRQMLKRTKNRLHNILIALDKRVVTMKSAGGLQRGGG
jgi:hypothetical protein